MGVGLVGIYPSFTLCCKGECKKRHASVTFLLRVVKNIFFSCSIFAETAAQRQSWTHAR